MNIAAARIAPPTEAEVIAWEQNQDPDSIAGFLITGIARLRGVGSTPMRSAVTVRAKYHSTPFEPLLLYRGSDHEYYVLGLDTLLVPTRAPDVGTRLARLDDAGMTPLRRMLIRFAVLDEARRRHVYLDTPGHRPVW